MEVEVVVGGSTSMGLGVVMLAVEGGAAVGATGESTSIGATGWDCV